MYVNFVCIFVYLWHLIVNKTNSNWLFLISEGISRFFHRNFFRMTIYTIYDHIIFSKFFYFNEDMNEKHSFLRDTCMLPGGSGKSFRLTGIDMGTSPEGGSQKKYDPSTETTHLFLTYL